MTTACFQNDTDEYGWQPVPPEGQVTHYLILDREGNPLLGDQLPPNETEARIACRIANLAYEEGAANMAQAISDTLLEALKERKRT